MWEDETDVQSSFNKYVAEEDYFGGDYEPKWFLRSGTKRIVSSCCIHPLMCHGMRESTRHLHQKRVITLAGYVAKKVRRTRVGSYELVGTTD